MTDDRMGRRAAPDDGHDDPASHAPRPARAYPDDGWPDDGRSTIWSRASSSDSYLPPTPPPHGSADAPPSVDFVADPPPRAEKQRRDRRSFRGSLGLTAASTVLPGSGLLGARRAATRILGLTTALLAIAVGAYVGRMALVSPERLAVMAVTPDVLLAASGALMVVGVVWAALIAFTHLATRPRALNTGKRALGALVVTALAFSVTAPTAVGARYARDQMMLVDRVFATGDQEVKSTSRPSLATEKAVDPFEGIPRLNILLLGADGNAQREAEVEQFSVRTDTIMLASIDTATGNTTLIQIPRNLQFTPFPDGSEMDAVYPYGFRGEPAADYYINGIWANVELAHPDLFEGSTYRGAEGLKQGVEGVTGLKVDYFVMLNIDGLQQLIDAMGGVTVNINQRLAIGGNSEGAPPHGYLEPGPDQHLMGYEAMWYARSRLGYSDYDRMARQSCLVDAVIAQANPATMLTRYEAIAQASSDMVITDIPQQDLPAIVELALRVKDAEVSRLAFTPGHNGYSYADPDFDTMRAAVDEAITASTASPEPAESTSAPSTTVTPSASSTAAAEASPSPSTPTVPEQGAQNVDDACAWQGDDLGG